jgi:hypothetical protein
MNSDHFSNYRKEGEVSVDISKNSKEKRIKKDIGDYINYEEVDDK